MSAPILWIILPLVISGILLLISNPRVVFLIACLFTFFLTLAAWLLPIDTALTLGGWTFKITPSLAVLGRQFTLTSADRALLALIYGSTFFWFIPSLSLKIVSTLIPLGLAITSLLVAALAVQPFLYAALLIEMAVLLSVPLLMSILPRPTRSVIRFLIFQTLAVPFILFSGWLLTGIGANPGTPSQVIQAAIFLALGFAFLLALFPFYSWIPMLAEEAHPYVVGFLLWILSTVILLYGIGFLDRYAWLRNNAPFTTVLNIVGVLMIVTGGLLSLFQRHLGRIMGFAVIVETGFSLVALNLGSQAGLNVFFLLLIPRTLCLAIWAYSLSILWEGIPALNLNDARKMLRSRPFASAGLILANLAMSGMPLLAGFPPRLLILEQLARISLPISFWVLIGSLGLFTSAVRVLGMVARAPEGTTWEIRERRSQRIFMIIGLLALFMLGLFPQWALPLWIKLP